jgi:CRISPR-associated endonuclease/helicase Cas3
LELQGSLEQAIPPRHLFCANGVHTPHHARYAPADRKLLDQALEERFSRPGGVVVCATQTVQQSLDIDADLMFTDLCPMDVLLQRIGRLHRHAGRARPPGFETARCVVLTPAERNLSRLLKPSGEARGLHGLGGEIYSDLRIIEATWRRLESGRPFHLPSQNRELVEHAQHPAALASIEEDGPLWAAHSAHIGGRGAAGRGLAQLNLVDWSCGFGDIDAEARLAFPRDGARVPTRLGEMDRLLTLQAPWTTPFGATVTTLKIPAWMTRNQAGELQEGRVSPLPDGRSLIESGDQQWLYGRWGLEPHSAV